MSDLFSRSSAVFSPCTRYRYLLTREFESGAGRVGFVMLNPSTADEETNDPTVRRCIGYARDWGFAALEVTNIFAWRATDPRLMKAEADPIGPENDQYLLASAGRCRFLVCAWGTHGGRRGLDVRAFLKGRGFDLRFLSLTKEGVPSHPLYLAKTLEPTPWTHQCPP